jgi:hypothetical protein
MESIPANLQPQHDAIVALIDPFCRERLTEEYRLMCRQLAMVLARKRPSPLVNGTPPASDLLIRARVRRGSRNWVGPF